MNERRLGFLFGVLGAVLLLLAAVLSLAGAVFHAFVGEPGRAILQAGGFLVDAVLGILMLLFSAIGARRGGEQTLAGGVILVVLGIASWALAGDGVLTLLGGLLGLIGGILFLVARR